MSDRCAALESMLSLDENPSVVEFGEYYSVHYAGRTHVWAYCFRKGARINTNMRLEHYHRDLKHVYLDGKKVKRVDKCLEALFEYVQDKEAGIRVRTSKGKTTKRHTELTAQHCRAVDVVERVQCESDGLWIVQSIRSPDFPYVVYRSDHICSDRCVFRCTDFRVYTWKLICSCEDYSIHAIMCRHIHAVCISETEQTNDVSVMSEFSNKVIENGDSGKDLYCVEGNLPVTKVKAKAPTRRVRELFNELMGELIEYLEDTDAITETVIKQMVSLRSVLLLKKNRASTLPLQEPAQVHSCNKLASPQRAYFSTKKSKRGKKRH